jgi:hypothetical protein
MTTQSNNNKKDGRYQKYKVISTNLTTKVIQEYPTVLEAGKILNIHPHSIQLCCEYAQKTSMSKNDGTKYSFQYCH